MKVLMITLAIVAVIVILLTIVYAYNGGFKTVTFREEVQGGETFVYEEMVGDYGKTYKVMEKIHIALLNDEKIANAKQY